MGRALGNNMINLLCYDDVREALEEMGMDLNLIEDQEPDAALGNGGLGRLAACFLDSLATLGYPAYGCGIRYHYGMFKQKIENGFQIETPDDWLKDGNPFEIKRDEYAMEVKFGGYVDVENHNGHAKFVQKGYQSVRAVPYDMPVVGYGNRIVNTLRIWDAEAIIGRRFERRIRKVRIGFAGAPLFERERHAFLVERTGFGHRAPAKLVFGHKERRSALHCASVSSVLSCT